MVAPAVVAEELELGLVVSITDRLPHRGKNKLYASGPVDYRSEKKFVLFKGYHLYLQVSQFFDRVARLLSTLQSMQPFVAVIVSEKGEIDYYVDVEIDVASSQLDDGTIRLELRSTNGDGWQKTVYIQEQEQENREGLAYVIQFGSGFRNQHE